MLPNILGQKFSLLPLSAHDLRSSYCTGCLLAVFHATSDGTLDWGLGVRLSVSKVRDTNTLVWQMCNVPQTLTVFTCISRVNVLV